MAQRNRAAVDVQLLGIELQVAIAGDYLRGKCFVQFDQIDLVQASAFVCPSNARVAGTGPMPMISGATPTIS